MSQHKPTPFDSIFEQGRQRAFKKAREEFNLSFGEVGTAAAIRAADQFRLFMDDSVESFDRYAQATESRSVPLPEAYFYSEDSLDSTALLMRAIDPNCDMLDADDSYYNLKEFETIIRQRRYKSRVDNLSKDDPQVADQIKEFWAAQHLSNAIEKTVSGAMHPHAMWRIL